MKRLSGITLLLVGSCLQGCVVKGSREIGIVTPVGEYKFVDHNMILGPNGQPIPDPQPYLIGLDPEFVKLVQWWKTHPEPEPEPETADDGDNP